MGRAAADDGFVGITERTAAFIVATDDDAENVYAVLAARVLAPDVPVIARAASSEAVRRLESAGALRVFSPPIEGALSIVGFVRRPHASDVLDQLLNPHSPGRDIREAAVLEDSALVGETLAALEMREYGISLLALVRGGHTELASASARVVTAGDVLVIVGAPVELGRLFQQYGLVAAQPEAPEPPTSTA